MMLSTARPQHFRRRLAVLLLAVSLASVSRAELQWQEESLPAGGLVLVAGGISPGVVTLRVIFPAGTADSPGLPLLAPVACRAWLGGTTPSALRDRLRDRGWSLERRCELEGAEIALSGPAADLDDMVTLFLDRLRHPAAVDANALTAAWRELEQDWERWARSGELALRAEMAQAAYGDHPYAVGEQRVRPAEAVPPSLDALEQFLMARYQAGAGVILAAGDLDANAFLARWRVEFQSLPGQLIPPPQRPAVAARGKELRRADASQQLYIAQFPGPRGDELYGPAAAVVAGVLGRFVETDVRAAGLCRLGSVWYDFTSPGPRPLEITLRGVDPAQLPALQRRIARLCDRMRKGEFSEYAMISAKDQLFERIDAAKGQGDAPPGEDAAALALWSREVLREALYFRRWRGEFLRRLKALGKEQVREAAQSMLVPERATLGLLLPSDALD